MRFSVHYHCISSEVAHVEADTKTEAVQKAKRGEVIEGTQDSDANRGHSCVMQKALTEWEARK